MIIQTHNGHIIAMDKMPNYKDQSCIELSIVDWCNEYGLSLSIDCMGSTIRDKWECDQWNITIYRTGKKSGFNTQYYTGIGHRVLSAMGETYKRRIKQDYKVSVNLAHQLRQNEKENAKPTVPHIAGILHSLTLDSSANDYSFNDWCDNFGYESDSIKALNNYQACCNTAKELSKLFTSGELIVLSELLQDY